MLIDCANNTMAIIDSTREATPKPATTAAPWPASNLVITLIAMGLIKLLAMAGKPTCIISLLEFKNPDISGLISLSLKTMT